MQKYGKEKAVKAQKKAQKKAAWKAKKAKRAKKAKKALAQASAALTPFDSLPDEVVLRIVKMAAPREEYYHGDYNHNFLVDVLCKVSVRFRRLATDFSLWKGFVDILYCGPRSLPKIRKRRKH